MWSTLGIGWNSLKMFSQIRTLPLGFETATFPEHHFVGSSTLETICNRPIRESSSLTYKGRGTGTLLGELITYGLISIWLKRYDVIGSI